MQKSIKVLAFVLAGLCLTTNADAQTSCPSGVNPLQLLVGTWSFSTHGFVSQTGAPTSMSPFSGVGQFVASIGTQGGQQVGLLTITQTSVANGEAIRQEQDAGTYTIFPDCSGGTLTFNLSTRPQQLEFRFKAPPASPPPPPNPCGSSLRFGSSSNTFTVTGDADPIGCGAGGTNVFCFPTFADAQQCTCGGLSTIPSGCPTVGVCNSPTAGSSCAALLTQKPTCGVRLPGAAPPIVPAVACSSSASCSCTIIP
jgi:hypothetical protein